MSSVPSSTKEGRNVVLNGKQASIAGQRGLAAWVLRWFVRRSAAPVPLHLLGRITLGPRQSLSLVEAEGVRILIGCSTEGGIVFFALGGRAQSHAIHPPVCVAGIPAMSPSRLKRQFKGRVS